MIVFMVLLVLAGNTAFVSESRFQFTLNLHVLQPILYVFLFEDPHTIN
jgi:hypothetical protein